jgi:hypothetical protein
MSRILRVVEIQLTKPFAGYDADTIFRVKYVGRDEYVCFKDPSEDITIPKSVSRWARASK